MNNRSRSRSASPGEPPTRRVRRARSGDGVLSIRPFRALWIALSLSSLGDWLSILALVALAPSVTHGSNLAKTSSISGVWVATLLPALLLGPIAGALADRLDRRVTMVVGDVIRGLLFISIPLFPNLTWIFVAKFLAGIASQFWNPAAAATIPNLVPKDKLERANQLSQLMTYGTAPLAAGVLALLGWAATGLGHAGGPFAHTNKIDLALYFNGASYFVSAVTVYFLRMIPKREHSGRISVPSTAKAIWEGWRFIRHTPVVRGLVIGMLGAFCAAGVVIGLAPSYIQLTLHGGSAGFSLVFAVILIGLAIGMGFGSRPFGDFSRRRLFGVTLTASAVPLAMIALVPNLAVVTVFVFLMGVISGIAYPTGFTIVGLEVDDATRGRVFAFFQSTIQAILLFVIAVAGFIATGFSAAIQPLAGTSNGVWIANVHYGTPGDNLLLLLSAALVAFVGIQSYRQLDDRKGVPLFQDLLSAVRNEPLRRMPAPPQPDGQPARGAAGLFLAFEGGEGAGKTTQARLTAHLAPRAGLRRGGHPRAGRDQDRHAAAGAAARHLPLRHVAAGRGAALRGRPGRARRHRDRPRPGARRGGHHRPLHRLLARLPGGRARHPHRRHRPAQQLGDRRPDARPHRAARHAAGDRAAPARPLGRPDGGRAARVPPPGAGRVPGPRARRA